MRFQPRSTLQAYPIRDRGLHETLFEVVRGPSERHVENGETNGGNEEVGWLELGDGVLLDTLSLGQVILRHLFS